MKKIIPFILITLFSCTNNPKLVKINCTLPEFIPFIEEFNLENDNIKIILEDNINKPGDITIFKGQQDDTPYETMDISNLIPENIFYEEILNSVKSENGEIRLLPLGFDIPGFIYNNSKTRSTNIIDIDDFTNERYIFSPYWNRNFILWYYLSALPNLSYENRYLDSDEFLKTAETMNSLVLNRDDWDIASFNRKYMHLSPEHLIKESIIDYYFYSLSDFISLSAHSVKSISFSPLSRNGMVFINDELTYIGINRRSSNKAVAKNVLEWMFTPENQEKYIKKSFNSSNMGNLFNNQLSTLPHITNDTLTALYPVLYLTLPEPGIITTYKNLPELWDSIKKEALLPIIKETETIPVAQIERKYSEYFTDWSKKHNK